jgi:NhaP-type Na+/H+ or K+/H+ antiporter
MKVDATTSAIAAGEAVVNDAVSIVVFESVLSLFYTHSNSHIVDFGSVPAQFAVVFFGSIFIGVAGGLVSALLTKHLPLNVYFISAAAERPDLMYSTASVVYGASASSPSSDKDADRDSHDSRMYLEVGFARFPAAPKPLHSCS